MFASSAGSTLPYPPLFSLRVVSRDGSRERQLTVGDVSYVHPEIVQPGKLFASRIRMQSDIWRFPVSGAAADNVRNGTPVTRQTGQVQTPSASPDGQEVAYLSDSGGHANVWIARIDGAQNPRPLSSEDTGRAVVGIPIWSPVDGRIVFIRDDSGRPMLWLINRDGSDRRPLIKGSSAAWSADGQWLYYQGTPESCIDKVRVEGDATPVRVRCNAGVPAPAPDGTLYFAPHGYQNANEIYKAKPEDDERAVLVTRYPVCAFRTGQRGSHCLPTGAG